MVIGAEVVGDPAGVGRLVVGSVVEGHGEGLHLRRALRLHQRHHQRGIDPAREERPQSHIRVHSNTHRIAEQGVELVEDRLLGRLGGGVVTVLGHCAQRPVLNRVGQGPRRCALLEGHDGAGSELGDAPVRTVRGRHAVVPEIQGKGVPVELGGERTVCTQGLELRTEQQGASHPAVVERLLAEPITGKVQPALLSVPDGEREHPVAPCQCLVDSPPLHRAYEDFCVGGAAKVVAGGFELATKIQEVVDLAVVRHHVAILARRHRLVPGGGEVDDRQAAGTQGDPRAVFEECAGIVGASVP